MSIELRKTRAGDKRYIVRYRDGGKNRARSFTTRGDARVFQGEIERRKRLGGLGLLDEGRRTLRELHAEWRAAHHPNLSPKSRQLTDFVWRKHLDDRLGDALLRDIGPREVERLQAQLVRDGVGPASVEKVLLLLGQMMRRAQSWGWVASDPVRLAHRPRKKRRPRVVPPDPTGVESIRARLDLHDATFVSIAAYGGLRPGEIQGLRWGDIGETHIAVERAVSLGAITQPKAGSARRVRVTDVLAGDIAAWRDHQGDPPDGQHVFPGPGGRCWGEKEYRAWRHRFCKAAREAGMRCHPYALRHHAASLMIASGMNVVQVARQLGHDPTMTLSTYASVFEDHETSGPIDMDAEVMRVRRLLRGLVPETCELSPVSVDDLDDPAVVHADGDRAVLPG
jgi:integrase